MICTSEIALSYNIICMYMIVDFSASQLSNVIVKAALMIFNIVDIGLFGVSLGF